MLVSIASVIIDAVTEGRGASAIEMFCPNCQTEYRDGFTRCSDCGAGLVSQLAEAEVPSDDAAVRAKPELLWTGINRGMASHIASALESARISYHQRTRDNAALPGLSEAVYAIFIHARDHQAAHAALEDVTCSPEMTPEEADEELENFASSARMPPETDDADDSSDVPQDYVPDDFDPAEATVEVWSGEDPTMRKNLVTFLSGIGIGSATEDSGGRLRIRVAPSEQKRAADLIRQVSAAT